MRSFARFDQAEKDLAYLCLDHVNREGGVLEHPYPSLFFKEAGIMASALVVDQGWFGFPTRKPTLLHIVGLELAHLPRYPLGWSYGGDLARLCAAKRSRTPPEMADWLVQIARRSTVHT